MSAQEEVLASPLGASITSNSAVDVEMACPLTSVEERNSRSRSSSPITERMSSFQSARERSERLGSRPPNVRTNSSQSNVGGWREETPASGPQYSYYQAPYDPHAPMMGGQYGPPRPRGNSVMMMGENSVPLSTISPGAVWPTEAQLSASYGYAIRREDGSVSRLYAADELPPPHSVPPRQGPEGLIIVPAPRQLSPNRRMGAEVMIPGDVVQQLATNRPYRPENHYYDATQMHIDSIVAHAAPVESVASPPRRREKIYCDKWIHEGVCAFTQMGCKYKHEMPMDKATQMTLGLNHGLPNWYRRAYAVNVNTESTSPPSISSPPRARTEGSWRSRAQAQLEAAPSTGSGNGGQPGMSRGARSFGPIAPPTTSNNPYSNLKVEEEDEEEDEEDDTVTWRGRRK